MDIRRRALFKKKASSSGGSTNEGLYTVNLNGQWELTNTVANPDSTLYDGVYRSVSNYHVNSGTAIMYITIKDCSSFTLYIRSYAESNYDYVMVSQLDKTINGNTSYSNTTLVKAHTRGNQQSGTSLSSYTPVEFTGISSGQHTITIVYIKDGSSHSGDDRGYVLIPYSDNNEPLPFDINNYLTVEALEDGLTACVNLTSDVSEKYDLKYCIDGSGDWIQIVSGEYTQPINTGQVISFRGIFPNISQYESVGTFDITKKCNLKGNCYSIAFGDNTTPTFDSYYHTDLLEGLFTDNINIVSVSDNFLSVTNLNGSGYSNMFSGCTSLIKGPKLPATSGIKSRGYAGMFSNCTSLVEAPELPCKYLRSGSEYDYMFSGCTSLVEAPELPATSIYLQTYNGMFNGCTSLTKAPTVLPATTVGQNCYNRMFAGCTSLKIPPVIKCTSMSTYYSMGANMSSMFEGCTSLEYAPDLLPTKMVVNCYQNMFKGCTNLTTAPELVATTLAESCYASMFKGCTKLNYIKLNATSIPYDNCLSSWVYDVAPVGTFVKDSALTTLSVGVNGIPIGWDILESTENSININNYLTIQALEDGLTASLSDNNCEYCVDGDGNWKSLSSGENTESIEKGQLLSFRGNITPSSSRGIGTFNVSKQFNLKGDCKSMLFGDNAKNNTSLIGKSYAFYQLFKNCTTLLNCTSNPLKASELSNSCYESMFEGCINLKTAPDLPAMILATRCYESMFKGCTALINYPELPASTMANMCYKYMFSGCTSISTAPQLPATTLATGCYSYMFENCFNLRNAPDLPATTLATGCYASMFSNCITMTTSPELIALQLVSECYKHMFYGCSNLNYIKMLASDTPNVDCLLEWVSGVSATGLFIKNSNNISITNGVNGIPIGWSVAASGYIPGNESQLININDYLTMEALEDGLTASLSASDCEYCVDGDGNWKSLPAGTKTESINAGHFLSFRGELAPISWSVGIGTFAVSKNFNLKGDCMSMLFGDNAKNTYSLNSLQYAFVNLFYNCKTIIHCDRSILKALTLVSSCYEYMFYDCINLENAPDLPATYVYSHSYDGMFRGCKKLKVAPKLPALKMGEYCYNYMFQGCSSLELPPQLPATKLSKGCYDTMFMGCSKLLKAPELPAIELSRHCYSSMFWGCTSLKESPILKAHKLEESCYSSMFCGCTNINKITMLATNISASYCLSSWMSNNAGAGGGVFIKHKDMNSLPTGTSGIPSGWTVVNDGEQSVDNWIIFTVNGVEYPAKEGMTWEDWINSSYYDQNLNITIKTDGRLYIDGDPIIRNSLQGAIAQYTNTEIVVNGIYNSM